MYRCYIFLKMVFSGPFIIIRNRKHTFVALNIVFNIIVGQFRTWDRTEASARQVFTKLQESTIHSGSTMKSIRRIVLVPWMANPTRHFIERYTMHIEKFISQFTFFIHFSTPKWNETQQNRYDCKNKSHFEWFFFKFLIEMNENCPSQTTALNWCLKSWCNSLHSHEWNTRIVIRVDSDLFHANNAFHLQKW